MAGDWIPISVGLASKREVIAISEETGRSRHEVCGLLAQFWGWASNESSDGNLPGVLSRHLPDIVGADGAFWCAVMRAGWLQETTEKGSESVTGLRIPNADNWITKGAKSRLQNTKSKGMRRRRVPQKSLSKRDKKGTTEEKSTEENRTEEDIKNSVSPKGDTPPSIVKPPKGYDSEFEVWWDSYPKKAAKGEAFRSWQKGIKKYQDQHGCDRNAALSAILEAARKFSQSPKGKGDYCPYPATWLNDERWADDPETWNDKPLFNQARNANGKDRVREIGPGAKFDPSHGRQKF